MKPTHIVYWRNAKEKWGSGDGFTLVTARDAEQAQGKLLTRWGAEVAEVYAVFRINPWTKEL